MDSERAREEALDRLVQDGLLGRGEDGRSVTTRRWQAALRRSCARLVAQGEREEDLRVPVALALVELHGDLATSRELVDLVLVLTELESKSLRGARKKEEEEKNDHRV